MNIIHVLQCGNFSAAAEHCGFVYTPQSPYTTQPSGNRFAHMAKSIQLKKALNKVAPPAPAHDEAIGAQGTPAARQAIKPSPVMAVTEGAKDSS